MTEPIRERATVPPIGRSGGCVKSRVRVTHPDLNFKVPPPRPPRPEEDIDGISNLNCKAPSLSLSLSLRGKLPRSALPPPPASCHGNGAVQSAYSAPFVLSLARSFSSFLPSSAADRVSVVLVDLVILMSGCVATAPHIPAMRCAWHEARSLQDRYSKEILPLYAEVHP